MKIGINSSFLRNQGTGIGQVTLNFIRKLGELQATDYKLQDLEFILYLEEDVEIDLPENFIKKVFLPKLYKRDDIFRAIYWQKILLPRQAKKDGCDVFLSLYQSATVMPVGIRHIMLVHDIILELFPTYLNNWRKKFSWKMTKNAIKGADKIIAISRRTEKDLIQHLQIDPKKITVANVAVDEIFNRVVSEAESQRVLEKYGLDRGYIYAGGGMEVRKNIEGTIRAYKVLLEKYGEGKSMITNFPILVVSGKLMPELAPLITDAEKLIEELGLGERVRLLGFVPKEDLPALYKNASLFCFPSLYEGFGLPVLEAMSQGVPTITSKKSSLPEVGGDAVLYCNPEDIDDMAMVMKNILSREELRTSLSERALRRKRAFSWQSFTEKVLHIIGNKK